MLSPLHLKLASLLKRGSLIAVVVLAAGMIWHGLAPTSSQIHPYGRIDHLLTWFLPTSPAGLLNLGILVLFLLPALGVATSLVFYNSQGNRRLVLISWGILATLFLGVLLGFVGAN